MQRNTITQTYGYLHNYKYYLTFLKMLRIPDWIFKNNPPFEAPETYNA